MKSQKCQCRIFGLYSNCIWTQVCLSLSVDVYLYTWMFVWQLCLFSLWCAYIYVWVWGLPSNLGLWRNCLFYQNKKIVPPKCQQWEKSVRVWGGRGWNKPTFFPPGFLFHWGSLARLVAGSAKLAYPINSSQEGTSEHIWLSFSKIFS